MKIIAGELPQGIEWRVLLALEPGQAPGIAWQVGSALAHANRGDLIVVIFVSPDDTERTVAAALDDRRAYGNGLNGANGADTYAVVIETRNVLSTLRALIKQNDIDLVLMIATQRERYDLRKLPCSVALLRLAETTPQTARTDEPPPLKRILIPTSGGPNSSYALSLMMRLGAGTELTACYVAVAGRSDHEEALGHERLRQVLDFVHGENKIHSRLVVHHSVAAGIVEEAGRDYDLIVIGATEESRLDHVIFGNIPAAVVEQTEKPVMILRQKPSAIGSAVKALDWRLHTIFPQKPISERAEIYARIRRDARPKMSFYVLITLSTIIAGLGLIINSPAVVIGAMLVAPLMSPIIGVGLAIVLGDVRFLRLAVGAVLRGVLLALLVGILTGFTAINRPFGNELLGRTQPGLYDLGIALFSGAAAAYALSFSQAAGALPGVAIAAALVPPLATAGIALVAGLAVLMSGQALDGREFLGDSLGALLLFATNFIAISTAAAFVFFVLGFRPTPSRKARREIQRRSSALALSILLAVGFTLGVTSFILARESATEGRIYSITTNVVKEGLGARLDDINILERDKAYVRLGLTVISPAPIAHYQVVELQQQLADAFKAAGVADDVALTISVIRVTELDPLNPPPDAVTPAAP